MKTIKRLSLIMFLSVFISCGGGGDDSPTPTPEEADAPKAAVLKFPLKDVECNEGTIISDDESTVTFEWESAEFATSYDVIYTDLDADEEKKTSVTGTTADITLKRGVPYAWHVISKSDKTDKTATSETWKLYNSGPGVISFVPFPAELVSPPMGGLASINTELEWNGSDADNNIESYDVYLDTANPPITLLGNTTSMEYATSGLTPDTVYYWRVDTKDVHGNATRSQIFEFRTQ